MRSSSQNCACISCFPICKTCHAYFVLLKLITLIIFIILGKQNNMVFVIYFLNPFLNPDTLLSSTLNPHCFLSKLRHTVANPDRRSGVAEVYRMPSFTTLSPPPPRKYSIIQHFQDDNDDDDKRKCIYDHTKQLSEKKNEIKSKVLTWYIFQSFVMKFSSSIDWRKFFSVLKTTTFL